MNVTHLNIRTLDVALAAATLACTAGLASAAAIATFDPLAYSTGALNGQDGWTATGAGSQDVIADATAPSSPNSLEIVDGESGSTVINKVVDEPTAGMGQISFFAKHDSGNNFSATSGLTLRLHATAPGGGVPDRFFGVGFVRDDDRFIWNVFGAGGSDPGGQSANGSVIADTWYKFEVDYEYIPLGGDAYDKQVDLKISELNGTVLVDESLFIANNNGSGRSTMEFISLEFAIAGNTSKFYVDSINFTAPEPGVVAMLGIGALTLGGLRRRRADGAPEPVKPIERILRSRRQF